MKNIVLIGMPGCGKSTLGIILSKKLNIKAIDMDNYIEVNENKTIKEMFAVSEDYFRNVESKYVKLLGQLDSRIISTGGGIVKREENIVALKKNSVIVFINRPIENIVKDVNMKTRPLLKDGVEAIYKLYNERIHLYKKYCHIEICNEGSIEEVANNIIQTVLQWEEKNK